MDDARHSRIMLCNLHAAQKLLVLAIVATVGAGYLAALANVFAQDAAADGKQTVQLEDFASVYRERGVSGLLAELQASLGIDDVIRKYHGAGTATRLESALNGSMRTKILENVTGGDSSDKKLADYCETLRQDLIAWSKLSPELRKRTYLEGVPAKGEEGLETVDFAKIALAFGPDGKAPKESAAKVGLKPILAATVKDSCVSCHAAGSSDARAKTMPLDKFEHMEVYCKNDRGMSLKQLALTSHVHLLGFAVLFAMSGFLFSLTGYNAFVRIVMSPMVLTLQLLEISCWWLAKLHVGFAYGIFLLGPMVGLGLAVQLLGILLDLLFRHRTR